MSDEKRTSATIKAGKMEDKLNRIQNIMCCALTHQSEGKSFKGESSICLFSFSSNDILSTYRIEINGLQPG